MPLADPIEKAKYMKAYRLRHKERLSKMNKAWYASLRREVLGHYSKGKIECNCCGEDEYMFMALDHINGGGTQHRLQLGSKAIYSRLKQDGYPDGFQVLCHNCNSAKGYYGGCPHKESLVKGEINE